MTVVITFHFLAILMTNDSFTWLKCHCSLHKSGGQDNHSPRLELPLVKTNRFKNSFINFGLFKKL